MAKVALFYKWIVSPSSIHSTTPEEYRYLGLWKKKEEKKCTGSGGCRSWAPLPLVCLVSWCPCAAHHRHPTEAPSAGTSADPLVTPHKVRWEEQRLRPGAVLPGDLEAGESDQATLQCCPLQQLPISVCSNSQERTKEVSSQQLPASPRRFHHGLCILTSLHLFQDPKARGHLMSP